MREEAGTGDPVIEISVTRKLAGAGWHVTARKGFLAEWRHGRQTASIDLRPMLTLPGAHNHQNACAAYAAARTLGLAPRQIEAALASYPGLAHRSQLVATWKGIRIVNDSQGHQRRRRREGAPLLRAHPLDRRRPPEGGRHRGAPPALPPRRQGLPDRRGGRGLRRHPRRHARTSSPAPSTPPSTAALAEAEEGEVVLLAPACASFDQFESFEDRGRAFEALVRARIGG